MSNDACFALGVWKLPGGNCAEWFSGTASALAVIVALTGYLYSEWHQRRLAHSDKIDDIVSLQSYLQRLLAETDRMALVCTSIQLLEFDGKKLRLLNPIFGVRPLNLYPLDKSQVRQLYESKKMNLIYEIMHVIESLNTMSENLTDYCLLRERIPLTLFNLSASDLSRIYENDKDLILRLFSASDHICTTSIENMNYALNVCEEFSKFTQSEGLTHLNFDLDIKTRKWGLDQYRKLQSQ